MIVAAADRSHVAGWLRLRARLWPDDGDAVHRAAIATHRTNPDLAAFVAIEDGAVTGFAGASLRRDPVNGCDTSPVAFPEGLAVDPAHRRRGTARALVAAVEAWGRARGCTELGSDADAGNDEGQRLHTRLGFEERERVVFYRKRL